MLFLAVKFNHTTQSTKFLQYFNNKNESICKIPSLELIGHSKHAKAVKCKLKKNWGFLNDFKWTLELSIKEKYDNIDCWYRNISRKDDFHLYYSKFKRVYENDQVHSELVEVLCKGYEKKTRQRFANIMLYYQIIRKPVKEVERRDSCKRLNLLLLSYDSVSRISWLMRLKKTTEYIFETMKFQQMNGMNIIGDGTASFFVPLLTGKTKEELPSTLKNDPKGKFVDEVYPFIFNDLHQNGTSRGRESIFKIYFYVYLGYATFYNEDWPHLGTFQYERRGIIKIQFHISFLIVFIKGAKKELTTHYTRAFQLHLWKLIEFEYYNGRDDLCIGDKKRHQYNLEILNEFMNAYKVPKFMAWHYAENSHDGNQRLWLADEELYQFLKNNYEFGKFNNTAIILYSDHGDRFNDDRNGPQGIFLL